MFDGPISESILKRAQDRDLISISLHNIRDYTTDRHHVCDDTPYGGGGGMIMKPEPVFRAAETVLSRPAGWQLQPEDAYVNLPDWDEQTGCPLPENVPILSSGAAEKTDASNRHLSYVLRQPRCQ